MRNKLRTILLSVPAVIAVGLFTLYLAFGFLALPAIVKWQVEKRADIARRMGIKLAPGEDPGPIDAADPRAQRAIEAVFNERYAPDLLALLKRRALEAAASEGESAASSPEAARKPSPPSPSPSLKQPPRPPPAFYQSLVDRLVHEAPVSEETLGQLAARRGEAIMRELTTVSGVPAGRVVVGETRKVADATGDAVTLRLELAVAE